MNMHKSAVDFAIKNHVTLGRGYNGLYYTRALDGKILNWSMFKTAKSAIVLMKKYLNR